MSRWDLLPLSSIFVRPEQSDGENGKGLRYDLTNEIYVKSYKEAAQLRLEEATAFQQLLKGRGIHTYNGRERVSPSVRRRRHPRLTASSIRPRLRRSILISERARD